MSVTRTSSTADLVRAARSGDIEAFGALVERHFGAVHAVSLARLRDPESAQDLAQEVFLRAQLHLKQLGATDRFEGWVCRIARNLAIDWQRRGQHASRLLPLVPLDALAHEVPDTHAKGVRESMAAKEEAQALRVAISHLPAEQREVVLLHFTEGLTHEEIATHLRVHRSTVSRQIQRALKSLRGTLEPVLREAAPRLRAPASAVSRSLAVAAAVGAMSATVKTSLAASAAVGQLASASGTAKAGAVGAVGVIGFVKSLPALIAEGAKIMATWKGITAGVVTVAAVAGAIHLHQQSEHAPVAGADHGRVDSAPEQATGLAQRDFPDWWEPAWATMTERLRPEIERIRENLVAEVPYALGSTVELVLSEGEAAHLDCVGNPHGVGDIYVHVGGAFSFPEATRVNIYMVHASGLITGVTESPSKGHTQRDYFWPGNHAQSLAQRGTVIVETATWEIQSDQSLAIMVWTLVNNREYREARQEWDRLIRERIASGSVPGPNLRRFLMQNNEALERVIQATFRRPGPWDSLPRFPTIGVEIDEVTRRRIEAENRALLRSILATLRHRRPPVIGI
jgi:RNA polymerase sigma-70 factor (ECF subfamily)